MKAHGRSEVGIDPTCRCEQDCVDACVANVCASDHKCMEDAVYICANQDGETALCYSTNLAACGFDGTDPCVKYLLDPQGDTANCLKLCTSGSVTPCSFCLNPDCDTISYCALQET